jgi:hypothetical protein
MHGLTGRLPFRISFARCAGGVRSRRDQVFVDFERRQTNRSVTGKARPNFRNTFQRREVSQRLGIVEFSSMATQIVMDHTGDSRHFFEHTDPYGLAEAEQRFKTLTGQGFTAATRTAAGDLKVVRSFDPTADETLFYPRLAGG